MEAEISIQKARLQARCVTSGVSHITSENLFALQTAGLQAVLSETIPVWP